MSVICEELAANDLGFAVIDIEGEYAGLSDHCPNIDSIDDIESLQRTKSIFNDLSQSHKKSFSMSPKRIKKS